MSIALPGKVFFVGAGPGDPGLLTVKAAKLLQRADVVVADRLVGKEIIAEYVSTKAQVIAVGKQGGSVASKPQEDINRILVKMAKRHANVVRLKGGDVTIFSNILDELDALVAANIPYELVPGITAVSGAAAYAGIPLTARNHSTGVRILTYYQTAAISSDAWQELARFEDTLVFYMSGNTLQNIVSKLLQAGAEPQMPFVVVEQATTPHQHVHSFTLEEFVLQHNNAVFTSPSLVVMGRVTGLYPQYAWLPNSENRAPYFKPLQCQSGEIIASYKV